MMKLAVEPRGCVKGLDEARIILSELKPNAVDEIWTARDHIDRKGWDDGHYAQGDGDTGAEPSADVSANSRAEFNDRRSTD
jgi:hypothetical protein